MYCFDGQDRLGISAGNIRKRYRIQVGDIVLLSLWTDIQDSKCSIVHKYDEYEARKLQSQGEFPENVKLEEENAFEKVSYDDDLFGYADQKPMDLPVSEDEDSESEEIDVNDI